MCLIQQNTVDLLLADETGDAKKNDDLVYDSFKGGQHIGGYTSVKSRESQWKRVLLLIIAITVHNIPEGLAVGVGFGATATSQVTMRLTDNIITSDDDRMEIISSILIIGNDVRISS